MERSDVRQGQMPCRRLRPWQLSRSGRHPGRERGPLLREVPVRERGGRASLTPAYLMIVSPFFKQGSKQDGGKYLKLIPNGGDRGPDRNDKIGGNVNKGERACGAFVPWSCQLRCCHVPLQLQIPDTTLSFSLPSTSPSESFLAMGSLVHLSEESLLGDKEYSDTFSLPFPSHAKAFGKRKRAFFATATLVSLLFLASYLTIQYRASDWLGNDLEPIPFTPQDVFDDELPQNATYPLASFNSGVRGPPTPLFRGPHFSVCPHRDFRLTKSR